MYVTTERYTGQMVEVYLETTGAETLRIRAGSRGPKSSWGEGAVPKEGGATLKRSLKAICINRERTELVLSLWGRNHCMFWLKNVLHPY